MKLFNKPKTPEEEISAVVQEATREKSAAGARPPLTHRTSAKVTAFIMVIVTAALLVGSAISIAAMLDENLYTTPESAYRYRKFENMTDNTAFTLIHYLNTNDEVSEHEAMVYLDGLNIASVEMKFSEGPRRSWGYDSGRTADSTVYHSTWYHMRRNGDSGEGWYSYHSDYNDATLLGTVEVRIQLSKNFTEQDDYFFTDRLISIAYAMRYWVYVIGIAALVSMIVSFVFLMCASGHRSGFAEPQPGWATKVPLDIMTAAVVFAAFLLVQFAIESQYGAFNDVLAIMLLAVCCAILLALALGWCMSFALRIKLGGWWRNTIIYRVLRLFWFILQKLCRGILAALRGIGSLLRGIPLVWKTAVLYIVLAVIDITILLFNCYEPDNLAVYWVVTNIIFFSLTIFIALMLRKLQKGGRALASGDLSYQVNTKGMLSDFKRHGENLNSIGEGMTRAVEQRIKSERMKTELITNVSHDIKTPLTSIINYSDLIAKEPCDDPAITEYAEVLHRQSERLKRLIDDLVEASKASTGNLDVQLAPCEVGVMLTQTAGEYQQKLEQAKLQLITRQPEQSVTILADGRRLWRVFDNLMNNICKYAQSGTRVYLTLEEEKDSAVITFRNTSRDALDLNAEDFMERFVRGDASRSSDGNGLGLSIAKSLTELQNGTMELTVDGDLFKVTLKFPVIK